MAMKTPNDVLSVELWWKNTMKNIIDSLIPQCMNDSFRLDTNKIVCKNTSGTSAEWRLNSINRWSILQQVLNEYRNVG